MRDIWGGINEFIIESVSDSRESGSEGRGEKRYGSRQGGLGRNGKGRGGAGRGSIIIYLFFNPYFFKVTEIL